MFYPGDPVEQRKRELIKRLSSSGKGAGGYGVSRSGLGRMPGFFGRGVGFGGMPGQSAAHNPFALAGMSPGNSGDTPSASFNLGHDVVNMGGQQHPADLGAIVGQPQLPFVAPQLRQLLGGYGGATPQPQMPSGFGNRFF